jgi:hypothetical protein
MFARRRMDRRIARRTARRVFHRMALAEEDVKKVEQHTGQPAEALTEEQLLAAMKKLGIKKLELDDDAR